MLKQIIIFGFVCCFFIVGRGQVLTNEEDTVHYSIIYDQPNASFLSLGVSYDISISGYNNMTLAAFGIDGFFMHKNFGLDLKTRFHAVDQVNTKEPYVTSIFKPQKSRDIALLGTWYFINNTSKVDQYIEVASRSTYNQRTSFVVDVPALLSVRYGLDFGFSSGFVRYRFNGDGITLTQNNPIVGTDPEGATTVISSTKSSNKIVESFFNYSYLKLGFSRMKISNVGIKTDEFGQRNSSGYSMIYAHAFVPIQQEMEDVVYEGIRYEINSGLVYNKLGLCIGYQTYDWTDTRWMSFGWGAEFGYVPGPQYGINNVYLDLKFRISLLRKVWN